MNALVSIITPCHNAEDYLEETILSVLAQSYTNWEMIIVDDNSADTSNEIIKRYVSQDRRIRYFKNRHNIGAAQSRNRAIKDAQGEYIAFLDSDDIWLPLKLQKQLKLMHEESVYLSYTSYYTIDIKGKLLSLFNVPTSLTYADMLRTSTMGTLTTIYNAKILGKFYFTEIGHEDYAMKLEILKKIESQKNSTKVKGLIEPLAKYRIHTQGLSNNKLHTARWQWHIYRNVEKLSLLKSLYYFIHYTYNGFMKYR